jgi:hypothetical protein
MKIAAVTLMAAMVGGAVEPGPAQQKVTLYLRDNAAVRLEVLAPALDLANKMFATIGIRLDWCNGEPPQTQPALPIFIELATDTPANLLPGALGYAMPYEGVHIKVFYDRIQSEVVPSSRAVLLAHVLVHEIAHILEGIYRHSDSGVMKALWTKQDHLQMQGEPLPFAPEDIKLIRLGLASRLAGGPAVVTAR